MAGVQQFFSDNYLLPNINCNFLVLIPKSEEVNEISHYRPIVLANFFFKIITKVIATRLGIIMDKIISPHQTAFVQGRSIHDCIALVLEGVNMLDKKSYGGNMGLKLDISRSF